MSSYEFFSAAHQAFTQLGKSAQNQDPEQAKNYRELAEEARVLMGKHKGKPPTPVVFMACAGYVTAGFRSKLKTFTIPSHRYSEGFDHATEIFTLGIGVRDVLNARDLVGEYKRPGNELRDRLNYCAKVLEDNDCREVAPLFRPPSVSISEGGIITFQPQREIILWFYPGETCRLRGEPPPPV